MNNYNLIADIKFLLKITNEKYKCQDATIYFIPTGKLRYFYSKSRIKGTACIVHSFLVYIFK